MNETHKKRTIFLKCIYRIKGLPITQMFILYALLVGFASAIICPPGNFVQNNTCSPCIGNNYSTTINARACTPCPNGVVTSDKASCVPCSPGTYFDGTDCQECQINYYQSFQGSTGCIACNYSTYTPLPGATECTPCQNTPPCCAGYVENDGTCEMCPAGFHVVNGACSECPTGRVSENATIGPCTECPPGEIAVANLCIGCLPGTYLNVDVCSNCTVGKYQDETASSECKQCPTGQYQDRNRGDRCIFCPPGYYENELGSTACKACGTGLYSNFNATQCTGTCALPSKKGNTPACVLCENGTYYSQTQSHCLDCPIGKFGAAHLMFSRFECIDCPIGFAQSNTGQGECQPCDNTSVALSEGLSQCSACPAGYEKGGETCLPCSSGMYSVEGTCINCPTGYVQPSADASDCQPCTNGTVALSQGLSECQMCPAGTTRTDSSTCTLCPIGQYEQLGTCKTCSNGTVPNLWNMSGSTACVVPSASICSRRYIFNASSNACQLCPDYKLSDNNVCTYCPEGYELNQSCVQCNPGQYRTAQSDSQCLGCPAGYYEDESGSHHCKPCGLGRYQDTPQQTDCITCPKPNVTTDEGSTAVAQCTSCPAGLNTLQNFTCGACAPGEYVENHMCVSCPIGYGSAQSNQEQCGECLAGFYSGGASTCLECAGKDYQNERGQASCKTCHVQKISPTTCEACPAGSFLTGNACEACPAGYWSSSQQTSCTQCAHGLYQDQPGQTQCKKCAAGSFQDRTGQNGCELCRRGTFQANGGQKMCVDCPMGRYQSFSGKSTCEVCPSGRTSTVAGLKSASGCTDCPVGKYSLDGHCVDCHESTYQDESGQASCKTCPSNTTLSPRGSTSTASCFSSKGLVTYVFDMKKDSKKAQNLTRTCEVRPNLLLLCPGCRCAQTVRDGFWASPVCDECSRGYARSDCKTTCPGYDGSNDDTICSGMGQCWFGKGGNGQCYCGGHSKIDKTAENIVVDVTTCSKGEECEDYQTSDETQYRPIYYVMRYRQYSVFVLKMTDFTPRRGHMWFKRYPRATTYLNDCSTCTEKYQTSNHANTYTGAYNRSGYFPFPQSAQSNNGFNGENCQYECGLCLHGGTCIHAPHPYRYDYTIFDTFERQTSVFVPQTSCECTSDEYDTDAMCCPHGFQPYIYYGSRDALPYARYSRTPYLTTLERTSKPYWVDKDLWISADYGPPDYFIPVDGNISIASNQDITSEPYMQNGPFGKHVFYGTERQLCRACPGLFGKGVKANNQKIETADQATSAWWLDASPSRKCNGLGQCDFYAKEMEPLVAFMGNAAQYTKLAKSHICGEHAVTTTSEPSVAKCIEALKTPFVAFNEPYSAILHAEDILSVDGHLFTTSDKTVAVAITKGNVEIPIHITQQGPAIIQYDQPFQKVGTGKCGTAISSTPSATLDLSKAALFCAQACMSEHKITRVKGFSSRAGEPCTCATSECTNKDDGYARYEWDTTITNEYVTLYHVLKAGVPLPKPDTETRYTVVPTSDQNCFGFDACSPDTRIPKYEAAIYSNTKGFGDARLETATFDRFDTCFTYTRDNKDLAIGSYITIGYEQGRDPFLGGPCPKGYFCTNASGSVGFKEACPAGYYQPGEGQTRNETNVYCAALTAPNEHCNPNDATEDPNDYVDKVCRRCPRNQYAPEGSALCYSCPLGKVKKMSGIRPPGGFHAFNTPTPDQTSPWYYIPNEAGDEAEDCATVPHGIIHVPAANAQMSYKYAQFLPIVTCPYGSSSPMGTFIFTTDEKSGITLETEQETIVAPYVHLQYNNASLWEHIVSNYCDECPSNTVTGQTSMTCTTCYANQFKVYTKEVLWKIALGNMPKEASAFRPDMLYNVFLQAAKNNYCTSHKCAVHQMNSTATQTTLGDCIIVCQSLAKPRIDDAYGFTENMCLCGTSGAVETQIFDGAIMKVDEIYNWTGLPLCHACQAGMYSDAAGKCEDCLPGTFTPDEYTAQIEGQCLTCGPGTVQPNPRQTSCISCSAGTYQNADHTKCNDCPVGFAQAQAGQISCTQCPSGQVALQKATQCKKCATGQYSNQPESTCENCFPGQYQPRTGQSGCAECPKGWSMPSAGGSLCWECDGGAWCDDTESHECVPGKYKHSNTGHSSDCATCPSGYFSAAENTPDTISGSCRESYSYIYGSVAPPENGFPTVNMKEYCNPNAPPCADNVVVCDWAKHLASGMYMCHECPDGWVSNPDREGCNQCGNEQEWSGPPGRMISPYKTFNEWPTYDKNWHYDSLTYKAYIRNEMDIPIKCYVYNLCNARSRARMRVGDDGWTPWYETRITGSPPVNSLIRNSKKNMATWTLMFNKRYQTLTSILDTWSKNRVGAGGLGVCSSVNHINLPQHKIQVQPYFTMVVNEINSMTVQFDATSDGYTSPFLDLYLKCFPEAYPSGPQWGDDCYESKPGNRCDDWEDCGYTCNSDGTSCAGINVPSGGRYSCTPKECAVNKGPGHIVKGGKCVAGWPKLDGKTTPVSIWSRPPVDTCKSTKEYRNTYWSDSEFRL